MIPHHMTPLMNLCLNVIFFWALAFSRMFDRWLLTRSHSPADQWTEQEHKTVIRGKERKKEDRGEEMLWSGECKLQEQNNTIETLTGEEQETNTLFEKTVNLRSYKKPTSASKNMRCKINITCSHLLLLRNYMKQPFWQASVKAEQM